MDFDVSYQYSLVNFEYSEREVALSSDAKLTYQILEHGNERAEHFPASMYIHEHSFDVMDSKYSALTFLVGVGANRIEVKTNVHRGMAMILAIDGVARVARARLHGKGFLLFDEWITKHQLQYGNFLKLKQTITDIMCGSYHPPLYNLSKVLCFCLLFGVVPERLHAGYQRGDDLYALVLSRASRGRSDFVDMLVQPFCR